MILPGVSAGHSEGIPTGIPDQIPPRNLLGYSRISAEISPGIGDSSEN